MSLADQIIEHGPYAKGDVGPFVGEIEIEHRGDVAELNELRDELLAARALNELLGRFRFPMLRLDDYGTYLACDRCPWEHELQADETLAELNQRASEHAEVCR